MPLRSTCRRCRRCLKPTDLYFTSKINKQFICKECKDAEDYQNRNSILFTYNQKEPLRDKIPDWGCI